MQRRYRLRQEKDFIRLRQEGLVYRHHWMLLSLLPNGLTCNRYGFIVTRTMGKAVVRNRARRLLREAVRQLHPQLQPGFDIVIVTRPALIKQSFHEIKRVTRRLFQQAGILLVREEDI